MDKYENRLGAYPPSQGLYSGRYEHDSCGVGFVANMDGHKDHDVIANGLKVLENLMHRGAIGGDQTTGDGAGILFQLPELFFEKVCAKQNIELPPIGQYGVGMVFLPMDSGFGNGWAGEIEQAVFGEGLTFLGWRDVPVNENAIAGQARATQPLIRQFFVDGGSLEGLRWRENFI